MKFIYHHLGLGDHIINNGMIRHFYKQYGHLTLFAYNHYLDNVRYMYRDLKNFEIIGFNSDNEIANYIQINNIDVIKVGFTDLNYSDAAETFDMQFYRLAGLDFSIRFSEFYIQKNEEKEREIVETLNPLNEKFIFIHDDPSRGFTIDMSRIRTDLKIITNDKRFSVFDYRSFLQNAEEIHFMTSSFRDLLNSEKYDKPQLYLHRYVRGYGNFLDRAAGLNKIIEVV